MIRTSIVIRDPPPRDSGPGSCTVTPSAFRRLPARLRGLHAGPAAPYHAKNATAACFSLFLAQ